MDPSARRFAAIDIGTVTCRLLVAEVGSDGLCELRRRCAITNLGIGVDSTGVLRDDAIERVAVQVGEYVREAGALRDAGQPAIPIVAVATSAARDAENSDALVSRLREVGVELAIIPGQREADLSFRGASCGFEGEHLLVADVGGGSTEIVMGEGGKVPAFAHSFNIGCRRMTERFLKADPPMPEELAALRAYVRAEFESKLSEARAAGHVIDRIVAVAGTATSVVAIDEHMAVYDSARVHGTVVPAETLERIFSQMAALTVEERKKVVGLEPARAGVVVAGLAILLEVLSAAGKREFTVSESDILQGIILDAAQRS